MKGVKTADDFFNQELKYSKELHLLRSILLKSGLTETIKWGIPLYCLNRENIVGTCEFKNHFGLWFYQGALLVDKSKKLINANEENTQALRQWRMNSMADIDEQLILQYVHESIENFKSGNKIKPRTDKPLTIPAELSQALSKNSIAHTNFENMSKGKKREYAEFIETVKQAKTKLARLEKIIPLIEKNTGLNDKYRS